LATLTRPIFLLTDFGTRGHYVGQVKAVIAGIAPGCPIYDLSHDVEPFAVEEGAWLLEISIDLLPEDAVVMAVVDPGVGTQRRAVVVQVGGRTFVGPDNGVLSGVAAASLRGTGRAFEARRVRLGEGAAEVRELREPALMRRDVSNTFHARDVFAPATAHIAGGADYRRAGPPQGDMVLLPEFCGKPAGMGVLEGEVIHVDRFGNLITTVRARQLFPRFALEVAGEVVDTHVRTFAEVSPGTPFCHIDSSGYLAVAMNRGNAAKRLGAQRGHVVRVRAR
jgi:S-adenosylmethionine hydrolase